MQFHDIELTGSLDISGSLTIDNSGQIIGPAKSTASFGTVRVQGFAGTDGDDLVAFSSSISQRVAQSAAAGTISGVTAGTGLSGGGSSGNVTVNVDFEDSDFKAAISGSTAELSASIATDITNNSSSLAARIKTVEDLDRDDDLNFAGDSGGTLTIDMDSETLTIAGGDNITTAGSGNTLTISNDFDAAGISGSLGPNAALIRSLDAAGVSGSFGAVSGAIEQRLGSLEAGSTSKPLVSSSAQLADAISGSTGALSASIASDITANSSSLAARIKTVEDLDRDDDLNFQGDSGGALTIDMDSETLTIAGGTNITTAGSGNTLTINNDFTAAGISGSLSNSAIAALGSLIVSASGDTVDLNGKKILFANVYSTEGDLPSATDNHGMFAHVHATGLAYFAHAGNWVKLAPYSGNISGSAQLADAISGSFFSVSQSISTRLTAVTAGGGEFNAGDSGSISSRLSGISGSTGALSASIASDITSNSSSLAARIKTVEDLDRDDDLNFAGDSGGTLTIDMDSETLTIAGGNNITTAGSGNTLTITNDFTKAGISGSSTALSESIATRIGNVENAQVAVVVTQASPSTTWNMQHDLNTKYPTVTVYDANDNVIVPANIKGTSTTGSLLTFDTAVAGKASFTFGAGSASGSASTAAITSGSTHPGFTVSGNLLPSSHDSLDLGAPNRMWRDLYLGPGSLYVDGQKVLHSDAGELIVETSAGQSMKILETGADDIILQTANGDIKLTNGAGSGNIELDSPVQVSAGNKISSSDGNNIHFGDGLSISGSLSLTGQVQGINLTSFSSSVSSRLTSGGGGGGFTAAGISGSFLATSQSISTRLTAAEGELELTLLSGSAQIAGLGFLTSASAAAAGFGSGGGGGGGSSIFTAGSGIEQKTLADMIVTGSVQIKASGSVSGTTLLNTNGNAGSILQLTDDLSTTLFSVAKPSGLPVMEVSASGRIALGPFSSPVIVDTSGHLSGSGTSTGSFGTIRVGGNDFSTAVSSSAAAAGFGAGGGGSFTAAGISGSLGPNAALIRSLNATGISGSLSAAGVAGLGAGIVSSSTQITNVVTQTYVSQSAAAAGFGSGGGGGGGGGTGIFAATGSKFATTQDVEVTGSLVAVSTGSNSTIFAAVGASEEMLTITDSLSGSLFSVVRNSGIPVMEVFSDGNVDMHNLPTSDPGVPGRLYNDSGTLKISL